MRVATSLLLAVALFSGCVFALQTPAPASPAEETTPAAKPPDVKSPPAKSEGHPSNSWSLSAKPRDVYGWLWAVNGNSRDLARATIIAIALLAALLTVIATWEIPPARTRPSSSARPQERAAADTAEAAKSENKGTRTLTAPFQGNFATTVLSGLGGMAAVSFVDDSFWKEARINAKAYYLILFVTFFLTILLLSALYQGAVEAIRSRVVLVHRPPEWTRSRIQTNGREERFKRQHMLYWGRRVWRWLLSWRHAGLIFLDTLFNVVQGRNQLQTAGFAKEILDLHWSQSWVANRVRESIDRAIGRALAKESAQQILASAGLVPPHEDADVRVNIGILSVDESAVSYFSWERGSLGRRFDQHSMAWISIASGRALWYRQGNGKNGIKLEKIYNNEIPLLATADHNLPIDGIPLLGNYYQRREAPDYEGFVILPIPWVRRGEDRDYQRAGVLISFRKAIYMEALWSGLEAGGKPNFADWRGLLECEEERPRSRRSSGSRLLVALVNETEYVAIEEEAAEPPPVATAPETDELFVRDPELQAVLRQGVEVLGEALRYFNPTVFEEQILPHLHT